MKVRWLVWAALVCLVLAWGGLAHAVDEVYVDIVINGQLLEYGGLIHGDRTYVRLLDVARVLGGEFLYDPDIKVAFVLTGNYANLVTDRLVALNPDLDAYGPLSRFEEGAGIPYGMPGRHVTVLFLPSGLAAGFGLLFPPGEPHQPWFDQPEGQTRRHAQGEGYTQTLHVIDPALIRQGGQTRLAFNGRTLDVSSDAFLWVGDVLWARLRDVAEASGGGVGWDVGNRVASAKIVAGADLTWDTLAALNAGASGHYSRVSDFVPQVGYRYGTGGPGLVVGLDGQDRVSVFAGVFPEAGTPWFPWFDQAHGAPQDFPGVGRAYTQHIYVVDRWEISR